MITKFTPRWQYLLSLLTILGVCGACFLCSDLLDYKIVAFILLATLSLLSLFFDVLPVIVAAVVSTLIWNFFFIIPRFTFHIDSSEDFSLLILYLIIAMVHAVLSSRIRRIKKIAQSKEERANTLRLYNTLLNSLSHELRTPIATIIGATDNLLMNAEKLSEENKKNLLAEISTASLRLNQQVENLLNMSRLESGNIQPRMDWCDVNELVYHTTKRLEENFKDRKIKITIQENLPLFKLDAGLLEEVIYNLINNAAIYTDEKAEIFIGVKCINNTCIITVEDEGDGFPAGEIEKVFDKFYRLKHSKTGGTGLGLSIAKGFVEAHNGIITLENRDIKGARFTITIPTQTSYVNDLKNE